MDDQTRMHGFGLKEQGGGHGIVDDVDQAPVPAEFTDALKVRHLGHRIGDGFDEDHFCGGF